VLPDYSDDLKCAVKKGIVASLAILQWGIRPNLASINAVIEPLGAQIEPVCRRTIPLNQARCNPDDGTTLAMCLEKDSGCLSDVVGTDPYNCDAVEVCTGTDTLGTTSCGLVQYQFKVCPISDTLPKCVKPDCLNPPAPHQTVQAYYDRQATDPPTYPARIYPGVLAAECIVRTLVPRGSRIKIVSC
jgi:hypothetical protein